MSDLISRQAVDKIIDGLLENDNLQASPSVWYGLHMIKQLPSAQPTVDAVPQWIPCSERLPEDDRTKVVTLANGNTEAGYYSNGDWWCIGDSIALENPTVIAWMPLPKPYEVEE